MMTYVTRPHLKWLPLISNPFVRFVVSQDSIKRDGIFKDQEVPIDHASFDTHRRATQFLHGAGDVNIHEKGDLRMSFERVRDVKGLVEAIRAAQEGNDPAERKDFIEERAVKAGWKAAQAVSKFAWKTGVAGASLAGTGLANLYSKAAELLGRPKRETLDDQPPLDRQLPATETMSDKPTDEAIDVLATIGFDKDPTSHNEPETPAITASVSAKNDFATSAPLQLASYGTDDTFDVDQQIAAIDLWEQTMAEHAARIAPGMAA